MREMVVSVLRFFVPKYRYGAPTPAIRLLERLRVAGMVGTTLIIVMYGTWSIEDVLPMVQQHVVDTMIGTPALPLGMLLLVIVVHRADRRATLRALLAPLSRVGAIFGYLIMIAVFVFFISGGDTNRWGAGPAIVLGLAKAGLGLIVVFVMVPLSFVIGYMAVRHWCVAADGHPMLPAVITSIFAVVQFALFFVDGGPPIASTFLRLAVGIGGPVGLAAIAATEFVLLRRQGISLRRLPPLAPPPPPRDPYRQHYDPHRGGYRTYGGHP